ncbi:hypothetical protein M413DRAFT_179197 [Hebeloma cylindrosporum]|uniref:Uncharacterized protein n=1 Tax=Hebeloma cylindrosporum TaxID=76867 RepID=A0A0C3C867_HEBCY|nr:hypothetical protein M413DRAFT_179197 [Hebeloma cylindrosporum h7]
MTQWLNFRCIKRDIFSSLCRYQISSFSIEFEALDLHPPHMIVYRFFAWTYKLCRRGDKRMSGTNHVRLPSCSAGLFCYFCTFFVLLLRRPPSTIRPLEMGRSPWCPFRADRLYHFLLLPSFPPKNCVLIPRWMSAASICFRPSF